MHRQGIAHGDLHLGNWIETKEGIKLLDWGLGSRKRFDVLSEIEDSPVSLGLGLTSGPKGVISMHRALSGYEQLVNKTLIRLDWLNPRTRGWTQAVNDHYDALDAMLRKAAGA
jgi:tRNA A-37 threonylcarbamoyl transferase component Bud32